MDNPYKSPAPQQRPSHTDGQGHSRSPVAEHPNSSAVLIASAVCWLACARGLSIEFKDLFGEPPPSSIFRSYAIALLAGLAVEFIGIEYFVRRRTLVIEPSFRAWLLLLAMLIDLLPMSAAALSLLHAMQVLGP